MLIFQFLQKGLKNARYVDKNGEKDIVFMVDLNPKQKVLIEMNYRKFKDETIILRNLYWQCNIFGQGLKKKDITYDNIICTYQFNLNTFYVDTKHKSLIEEYNLQNQNQGFLLREKKFKIYHMNIAEMGKVWYHDDIHKYDFYIQRIIRLGALLVIDNLKDFRKCLQEMDMPLKMKKEIERIVIKMNGEDDFIYEFFDRETDERMIREGIIAREKRWAREEGLDEGRRIGMKQGMKQGIQFIKNMSKNGMTIDEISRMTDTSKEYVQKLLKS